MRMLGSVGMNQNSGNRENLEISYAVYVMNTKTDSTLLKRVESVEELVSHIETERKRIISVHQSIEINGS